jgi:ribulose-5-phosphate 4-epimerase/fuculose-1-phosphate aldolase
VSKLEMERASGGDLLGEASRRRGLRLPPIGVELDLRQRLACAFRILAHEGMSENFNGHITCDDGNGNLLVNPWGYWWEEVTASLLLVISPEGEVIEGDWNVTPAVHIHTEVHRAYPDVAVVAHNHPYYATLLASMGVLPEINTQTSCLFDGDLSSFDEFSGPVIDPDLGRQLAAHYDGASSCLLWSHGALVSGRTIEEMTFRMVCLERASRLTYDMLVAGRPPLEIGASVREATKIGLLTIGVEAYWVGAVRQLLRREPETIL